MLALIVIVCLVATTSMGTQNSATFNTVAQSLRPGKSVAPQQSAGGAELFRFDAPIDRGTRKG